MSTDILFSVLFGLAFAYGVALMAIGVYRIVCASFRKGQPMFRLETHHFNFKWLVLRPGVLNLMGTRMAVYFDDASEMPFHVHRLSEDLQHNITCLGTCMSLEAAKRLARMRVAELYEMGIHDP